MADLLGNLRLMLVSASLAVLLLELVARLFYVTPQREMTGVGLTDSGGYRVDHELGWLPKENARGRHEQSGFSSSFKTNSRGLRDREYPLHKRPGTKRIVVVGDSFTWGYGVNDGEIYTEQLEATLADTEVINLGVTAFGLEQEVLYLEREGMRYEPDVVILGFCLNDIDRATNGATWKAVIERIRGANLPARRLEARPRSFKQSLYANSTLYRFVVDRINTNKRLVAFLVSLRVKDDMLGFDDLDVNLKPALKQYPAVLRDSWEKTKADLLQLRRLTADRGIRLLIAVVPSLQSVEPRSFEHTIAYSAFAATDFDLDKPYRLLAEFASLHAVELVNPIELFRRTHTLRRPLYLPNDMHFNASGHALFARAIAAQLEQPAR